MTTGAFSQNTGKSFRLLQPYRNRKLHPQQAKSRTLDIERDCVQITMHFPWCSCHFVITGILIIAGRYSLTSTTRAKRVLYSFSQQELVSRRYTLSTCFPAFIIWVIYREAPTYNFSIWYCPTLLMSIQGVKGNLPVVSIQGVKGNLPVVVKDLWQSNSGRHFQSYFKFCSGVGVCIYVYRRLGDQPYLC